jgi:hypothetical protein
VVWHNNRIFCCCFEVLGFEHRAFTLSHSTSPFFLCWLFQDKVSWTICLTGFKLRSFWSLPLST